MTNRFDHADEKLREEYEETFFEALIQSYTAYQGEQLQQQAAHDAPPEEALCRRMDERIAQALQQQRRRRLLARLRRAQKYIAMLLIVVSATFAVSFVTVEAFRVRVLNFFVAESGASTIYALLEEQSGPLAPRYIPEDMSICLYDNDPAGTQIFLQNADASRYAQILFCAWGTRVSVNSENLLTCKQVDINGTDATYTEQVGLSTLVWATPDNAHIAVVFSNLPEDEILAIARSIPSPAQ